MVGGECEAEPERTLRAHVGESASSHQAGSERAVGTQDQIRDKNHAQTYHGLPGVDSSLLSFLGCG